MTSALSLPLALEQLYLTFSPHVLPGEVGMAPHRDPEEELGALMRKPLRQITAGEMDLYASHALTTVGDVDLFKYALPRLLELVSEEEMLTDEAVVLSRLTYAEWMTWPAPEQAAIRDFLLAWWAKTLQVDFGDVQFGSYEVLCSVAQAETDLTSYLEFWFDNDTEASIVHLAGFLSSCWSGQVTPLSLGGFWNRRSVPSGQVIDWMMSLAVREKLRTGIDNLLNVKISSLTDELLDLLSDVGYILDSLALQSNRAEEGMT